MHGLTIICLNYISGFSLLINDILCPKISLNFNNMLTISWLNYTSGWQCNKKGDNSLFYGRQNISLWRYHRKTDGITIKIQTTILSRSPSGKILVITKEPQKNWRHPNKNLNTGKNPGILMGVIIQCRSLSGTNYRCAQFTGIHPHRLAHEPA